MHIWVMTSQTQEHLTPPIRSVWLVDRLLTAHNMILSCVVAPPPSPVLVITSAATLLIPQNGQRHLWGICSRARVCVCTCSPSLCVSVLWAFFLALDK